MPTALFHDRGEPADRVQGWAEDAVAALGRSPAVVVTIGQPLSNDPGDARRLEGLLADVVERVVRRQAVNGIFVEGGATAAAVIRRLGWTRLTVLREIAPGVVSLRSDAPQAPPLTMKPGSYAWPEAVWG
jgi:uncharacterized protein YgbK (DUF1537 family)